MHNFYWLIDDRLAGCSQPGNSGPRARADGYGAAEGTLTTDLAQLRERGITALLSLTESPLPSSALDMAGIVACHVPIPDMTAPTPEQFERALAFIDRQLALGHRVAVHCLVGEGRTGTLLAAYLIRTGHTSDDAISALRAVRSGAIASQEQQRALRAFAARRDWIT